jgi:hypothetical protein
LGAIVISSPVAGLRPFRAFDAGLTRTVNCTRPPILTFWGVPKLLEHDLLERLEHPLGLRAADSSAVSDGAR